VARMVSQPIHLLRMLQIACAHFRAINMEEELASAPQFDPPLPVKSAKTRGRAEVMRTKFRFCADSATPAPVCATEAFDKGSILVCSHIKDAVSFLSIKTTFATAVEK